MAESSRSLSEIVRRLAAARGVSPEQIVREAVEQYVDRDEQRQRYHRDALAAWHDYQSTGLHVSDEEADRWLAQLEAGEDAAPPECHR
ncbi:MAG TPA: ribbon-helix-helix protein, CopG family [Acidobacteriaceae bacterium]|nr:ribbon-helix-helix protein, CopG family [Acidobacteriaceae bacterium]